MDIAATSEPRLLLLARDIKLSHSIFALPFALLAAFLAPAEVHGALPSAWTLLLIVTCMVLARTVAMTVNRLADARFDAANPRTVGRAIPSGRLTFKYVLAVTLACAAAFVAAAGGFYLLNDNPWPLLLSPLVLLWVGAYSFTKRFTWLCHLFLGSALAISPLAAAIAVEPAYLNSLPPYLLAVMVMCWVAGFDIIYAMQDIAIDRGAGLYSLPAKLGVGPALWVSRVLHLISAAALVAMATLSSVLGIGFAIGVGVVIVLLIIEHASVWGAGREGRINMAFFTINGLISLLLGSLGIIDVLRETVLSR